MKLSAIILLNTTVEALAAPKLSNAGSLLQSRQYDDPKPKSSQTPEDQHRWIPAKLVQGSVRSPCPWMNTAANHGFIPRDGKGVSIVQFNDAIVSSLGYDPQFALAITTAMLGKLGVLTNTTQDALLRIDLDQTNAHDKTEHDASLTRLDASQGDASSVQPNLVRQFIDDTSPESFPYLNTSSVGHSRARREKESRELGNPPLSEAFISASQGEAAQVLLIMGDDVKVTDQNADARRAYKDRIQVWLGQERFPYDLGFRAATRRVQASELTPLRDGITKFQQFEQMFEGGNKPADSGPYVRVVHTPEVWH